jgi:hypothetical protein
MRWGVRFFVVVLVLVGLTPASADAAQPELSLGLGQAAFWKGGHVVDAATTDAFSWPLTIAAGGARLRVAIDTPSRQDSFQVDVVDPAGVVASSATNSNQFNAEAFVDKPAAGKWTIRVTPVEATDAPFRMRAKLEDALPAKPAGKVALLPNLKAVPPMEFGFIAPANPLNGLYPPDTVNPPLDVAGIHPISCAPDESAPTELGGAAAHRCLRLTSGPINVGSGAFDMRFDMGGDMSSGKGTPQPTNLTNTVTGPMQQAVHYSDGTVQFRPAGSYSFHTTHGHFHTDQILTYELFKVTNPATGALQAAGGGTKSGFCPADQFVGNWRTFTQRAPGDFGEGDSPTGNCFSPAAGALGLTVGWGDVYRWQRPGQFVEFGDNTDGLYVVRTTVDKSNLVLEENDADNAAYALIDIKGEAIKLMERGQGLSPFDPNKVVFTGLGPASADAIDGDIVSAVAATAAPVVEAARADAPVLPATGGGSSLLVGLLALQLALALRSVARWQRSRGRVTTDSMQSATY